MRVRQILPSLLLATVASAAGASTGAPLVAQVHAAAAEARLEQDPQWAALLHVDGTRPAIPDPGFLLSQPRFSLGAELHATIDALYGHKEATAARCRFPARLLWLQARLGLPDADLDHCPDWVDFRTRAPAETVSLVFASEHLSQPASMLGHLFLRLEGQRADGQNVAHALSFYTDPVSFNIPKLVYDGLVGGMAGYFSLSPFEREVALYVGEEQRNLWIYPLKLDASQRTLFQAHAIELKQTCFRYLFQSHNCATLVWQMLAAVQPALSAHRQAWTTPKDVLRSADAAGLLDTPTTLTASRWALRLLTDGLPAHETGDVRKMVLADHLPTPETVSARPERAFLQRELAGAYNRYLVDQGQRRAEHGAAYAAQLATLDSQGFKGWQAHSAPHRDPAQSPPDSQWSAGWLWRENRHWTQWRVLPVSHGLEDDNRGYFSENSLQLMDLSVLASPRGDAVRLERATLYSVASLLPRDVFTGGVSGRMRIGVDQQPDRDLRARHAMLVDGALGATWRVQRDVDLFALAGGGLGWRRGIYVFGAPQAGMLVREVGGMKSIATLTALVNAAGSGRQAWEARWTQSVPLSAHWTLVAEWSRLWQDSGSTRAREAWSVHIKQVF